MIKKFKPLPYDGSNPLPNYVENIGKYELIGIVPGGYRITLAKLTTGDSVSAGTPLAHALFESYTDHGEPAKVARTRVNGYDKEFIAIRSAMNETGVEFNPTLSCPAEIILTALGDWIKEHNPEIEFTAVVSQTCH